MRPGQKKVTSIVLFIFSAVFASNSWAEADFTTIDTSQLHRMVMDNAYEQEAGRAAVNVIVDARTEGEYIKGHVLSAINVPEKYLEKSVELLPKDREALLVIYCDDTMTNRKWADKATAAGYRNVVLYSEGFAAWKKKKMPTAPLKD